MKILVSGAGGLVGSVLVPFLRSQGHDIRTLVRHGAAESGEIHWNTETGELDRSRLDTWDGPDAVVHLAGENIGAGRWTISRKKRIRDSRVAVTHALARSLLELAHPPQSFICASAVGYYGNRGEEVLTESSSSGTGFLAEVCRAWEDAADPLRQLMVRIVHLRFGMILSAKGGVLAKMLPLFRTGFGGRLGDGRQWWTWITLHDVIRVIDFALRTETAQGPFNAVAPAPVRNAEFTRALASVLHRPAFLPAPTPLLRLALGEMADEMPLASSRVLPQKLTDAGFHFDDSGIVEAFEHVLSTK